MKNIIQVFLFLLLIFSSCKNNNAHIDSANHEKTIQTELDSALNQLMQVYELPGLAVGIIKGNKVVYAKGFGLRRVGLPGSIDIHSSFHMASVSKTFVAMAILQLVDKGKLTLDSPLTKYIPYFKMKDLRYKKITIKQMLTHTSGFPDVKDYGWDRPQYEDGALEKYIRDSVSQYKLLYNPGLQFSYSNMAYDVLAEVIAQVSGMPFETYMKENIFTPCGMSNSTFLVKDVPQRFATSPHVLNNDCYFGVSELYPYNRSHAGSSTLHSNIEDMLKWESVFINNGKFEGKEILSPESMKMMLSSQPLHTFDESGSEGLGLFIENVNGKKLINHLGSDIGYSTYFGIIPQDSVAIVFMSNLHRFVPYDVISNTLFEAVYNLPVAEFKKPINLVIAPLICKEGFASARKKFLELQKDSAGKYDFGEYWINTLGNAFAHLDKMDDAKSILSLNTKIPPKR